jgi:hypothetical protein
MLRRDLLPEHVAAYGVEILSILARLHRRGVLHGDIKPDNVIQSDDRLTLIDLGAARLIGDRYGTIIGTPGYQVSAAELDTYGMTVRADLHAVGRTLEALLRNTEGTESLTRLIARAVGPYEQRYATADEMRDQLAGVLRELLSLRDGIPRPMVSSLFSATTAPLDGSLGDIPEVGEQGVVACPLPAEVAAALPVVQEPADAALRANWEAGVRALAAGDVAHATELFDRCHSAVPGEVAPTVALAFCAELSRRNDVAAEYFAKVWARDRNVGCAAFGLARLRLAAGDEAGAVFVLDEVPDFSPDRDRARIAAVRVHAAPESIPAIGLNREAAARLTAAVLETALSEDQSVRDRLAAQYRLLAHYAATPRERTDLLDRAVRLSGNRALARQDRKARGSFEVTVEQTDTDGTLTVLVSVLATRGARDVRLSVSTTHGTTLAEPDVLALGTMRRQERRDVRLTFQALASGTAPGEAVVADLELTAGPAIAAAIPIVARPSELHDRQWKRAELDRVVVAVERDADPRRALSTAAMLASQLDDQETLRRLHQLVELLDSPLAADDVIEPVSTSVASRPLPSVRMDSRAGRSPVISRPSTTHVTALIAPVPATEQGVHARVRCEADVVVPGQRARVALTVWAGGLIGWVGDPVAVRVLLDSAPAEVHPVSRVTVLTDDQTMVPVDFDVVPEAPGPLPLVFRIYRDADSHLLLEIRAELPVEVAS